MTPAQGGVPDPDRNALGVDGLTARSTFGAIQVRIAGLCALVALLDGFDLQVMGLVAPAIAGTLHLGAPAIASVLGAGPFGMLLGAIGLGMLADRIGRKRVLIASTLVFGAFTFATGFARSLHAIVLLRLLTGLGLGGAAPSFISLCSECSPTAWRSAVLGVMWAGFPLGGVAGGFLASTVIEGPGWRWMFYVGGAAPLALAPLLMGWLPESPPYLVAAKAGARRMSGAVSLLDRDAVDVPGIGLVADEELIGRSDVRVLFRSRRACGTVLLWIGYFMTFLILVANVTWAPTLLHDAAGSVRDAALALAAFNFGSVGGTSLAGFFLRSFDRRRVLPATFIGAAFAFGAVGYVAPAAVAVAIFESLGGFFLGVGSSGLIALAAAFYPTMVRSTGVGWAMGFGRFGSFAGPLVLGGLVGLGWSVHATFLALAVSALCAAMSALAMGRAGAAADGPFVG